MEIERIKELMKILEDSSLAKLVVKQGDVEIHLEKGATVIHRNVNIPQEEEKKSTHNHHALPSDEASHAFISSPMVGTFYPAPSPDQPPFVKRGDKVSASTILCIIEAMKVMNEVKAGIDGTVVEILVDTAQPVEFGTRLFKILPHR